MSLARAKSPKFEASIVPIYTTGARKHNCGGGEGAGDESHSPSEPVRGIAPLHYRALQDSANKKYLSAPGVVQHLIKQGFIDVDGTNIPSRDEEHHLSQIRKVVKERKEIVKKLQEKDEARLRRLQDSARVNELIYTNNGIYEIDTHRRPVQRLVRDEAGAGSGELVKPKKIKKKKRKRSFRVEKEKGRTENLDTYILYPASPNESFLDIPAFPGQQLDKLEGDHDDDRRDLDITRTPSPDPLHFHLPASNLDKASVCIKDGILSRDIPRPREGSSAGTVKRRKKRASHHKRHAEADVVVRKSKSVQLAHSSSRRGMGSKQGDGMKLVDDDAEIYNRKNASKLPELVSHQIKSPSSTFRKTVGDSYFDNLKVHNSRWSRKHDLANAIKRVKDKYGGSILSDDSSSKARREHSTSSMKLNMATKSVQHSVSDLYETTDSANQTREEEVQREDLLELLRELVMTPRQYLDAVMEMIEKELCQPDVSYNRMLKQVLQYSAIEKEVANRELNEQMMLLPYEYQIDNQRSELPRYGPGQYPPYLRGSSPVLASLARHVVEDFMFDQNIPSGATASKGMASAGLRRTEATNYDIEHGAHGLHTSISFQPSQTSPMDKYEDYSQKSSDSLHSPSNASCHFNKVSGEIYHMYLRKDGSSYFSMLSPKERGTSCYSSYLGSYKENKDEKMTLIASPSSLCLKDPSEGGLSPCESSSSLDDAPCSSVGRVPGFNYYKYRKEDGSSFLTTVSPKTWGESCPHSFVKMYRESKSGTSTLAPVKTESATTVQTTTVQASNNRTKSELEMGPINISRSGNKSSELADDLDRSEHSDSTREEVQRSTTPLPLLPVPANDFVSHSISGPAALPHQDDATEDVAMDTLTRAFSSVECSFPRSPGKVYHLYKRRNGSTFLSTLPPQEVHEFVQDTFVASYIQGKNAGKMTLVEQEDDFKTVPRIIYCAENQEFESKSCNSMVPELSEQEVIKRLPSREFVDALLQVSKHHFDQDEKSWVDEFLTDGKGLPKKGRKASAGKVVTRSRSLNSGNRKSPTKLPRRDTL